MELRTKITKALIKFFGLICCYCVKFNWNEDAYFEQASGIQTLIWNFQELCTFSAVPVFALNLQQKWRDYIERNDIAQLMINLYFLIVFPFCCTFQYMFYKHKEEMITLVNQTIKMARHFESKYVSKESYDRDRRFRHGVMAFMGIAYINNICIICQGLFCLNPLEGRYLSSYFLRPYYERVETKTVAFIIGFLFEYWFISTQMAGLILQIYINLLYLQTMSTSLKGLRKATSFIPTKNNDNSIKTILAAYTKLRILSLLYNEAVGQLFLSRFKSTSAISCIASAFLLIKLLYLKDPLVTGLGVGAFVVLVGSFAMLTCYCSRVHEESSQLRSYLLSMKTSGRAVNRDVKSYKVIGVKVGSFFLVKRATPLTMLAMISSTTMTLLISINFSL